MLASRKGSRDYEYVDLSSKLQLRLTLGVEVTEGLAGSCGALIGPTVIRFGASI